MPEVLVPADRVERWVANFATRHGEARLVVATGALHGTAPDRSTFAVRLPFDAAYDGPPDPAAFTAAVLAPELWGVLLVRKGGFAVARCQRERIVASKVGQRHVQGRTKAGGQSQQRFARRRDNQARQAYEAAADHAARLLSGSGTGSASDGASDDRAGATSRVRTVVTGGDRTAVEEVLTDPRLARLVVVGPWLAVPDPRRGVLEQALLDAQSVRIEVTNA